MERERPSELHQEIDKLRPKDHLVGQEILDLAASCHWQQVEWRSYARDAIQLPPDRSSPKSAAAQSRAGRLPENDPSGVYVFGRSIQCTLRI